MGPGGILLLVVLASRSDTESGAPALPLLEPLRGPRLPPGVQRGCHARIISHRRWGKEGGAHEEESRS